MGPPVLGLGIAIICSLLLPSICARAQVSEIPWHSFSGPDGARPQGALTAGPDGALYGVCAFGGPAGNGVVFKIGPGGAGFRILHGFGTSAGGEPDPSDGMWPSGRLLLGNDGALYGTTTDGGTNQLGTMFRINPDGTGYAVYRNCTAFPWVALQPGFIQGLDGAFYGVAFDKYGSLYRFNPDGTGATMLHQFGITNNDGMSPNGALVQRPDGALYGTTFAGGSGSEHGTVYKINLDGTDYTILHNFWEFPFAPFDGCLPQAGLTLSSDGALYGTTTSGGMNCQGALFAVNPDGTGYGTVWSFAGPTHDPRGTYLQSPEGLRPKGELLAVSDGALYGTTSAGGQWTNGTVFCFDPMAQALTVLYNFQGRPGDGSAPTSALVQGPDGALYGTTDRGGEFGLGMVFRIATPRLVTNWQQPLFAPVSISSNGSPVLRFGGALNASYQLLASTNLADWTPLNTFTNAGGLMQWVDLDATNYPHRFYRAALVP